LGAADTQVGPKAVVALVIKDTPRLVIKLVLAPHGHEYCLWKAIAKAQELVHTLLWPGVVHMNVHLAGQEDVLHQAEDWVMQGHHLRDVVGAEVPEIGNTLVNPSPNSYNPINWSTSSKH
jgi:hypothetical protein